MLGAKHVSNPAQRSLNPVLFIIALFQASKKAASDLFGGDDDESGDDMFGDSQPKASPPKKAPPVEEDDDVDEDEQEVKPTKKVRCGNYVLLEMLSFRNACLCSVVMFAPRVLAPRKRVDNVHTRSPGCCLVPNL